MPIIGAKNEEYQKRWALGYLVSSWFIWAEIEEGRMVGVQGWELCGGLIIRADSASLSYSIASSSSLLPVGSALPGPKATLAQPGSWEQPQNPGRRPLGTHAIESSIRAQSLRGCLGGQLRAFSGSQESSSAKFVLVWCLLSFLSFFQTHTHRYALRQTNRHTHTCMCMRTGAHTRS